MRPLCLSSYMPSSLSLLPTPLSLSAPVGWMLWAAAAAAAGAAESARCAASAMRRLLSAPRASPSQFGSPRWLLSAFCFRKRLSSLFSSRCSERSTGNTLFFSPSANRCLMHSRYLCLPCAQTCSSVGWCRSLPEAVEACFYCDGEKMARVEAHAARRGESLHAALLWSSCFYF